jgi:hypothetical protein
MSSRIATIGLIILALNTMWFVVYAGLMGIRGLTDPAPDTVSRVFADNLAVANMSIALHMLAGALLTVGAPLQALPVIRRRWPWLHRRLGYALFGLALATGIFGLGYILAEGTVGGWWMSLWFAVYGGAMIWAATRAVQFARARDFERHFAWATRLVILAVGSWIYRMHYVIWQAATGGAGSQPDFSGLFDRVQVFAFFVPYLLLAEVFLRMGHRRRRTA